MTTEQIYNEIIVEKESGKYPELDSLNSTSRVSVWRLWAFITAFFSKAIEELFDSFKIYIESVFAKNQPGTIYWWITRIKEFQFDDELEFIDGVFKYNLINISKQIIAQVALQNVSQILVFKVVKLVDGNLTQLEEVEKNALQTYINRIKFPGTFAHVISQPADNLKLSYRIYYDALLNAEVIADEIDSEIWNYIQNIVFNGKFVITELNNILQKVAGVINPVFISGQIKTYNQTDLEYAEITDFTVAASGYFELFQLNIEFIAE